MTTNIKPKRLFLRHSGVKVHKRSCGVLRHNLSKDQLSQWKQQFLENAVSVFTTTDQHANESAERIAHLEHPVGRLTVALDIPKKSIDLLELMPFEQCQIAQALRIKTDKSRTPCVFGGTLCRNHKAFCHARIC